MALHLLCRECESRRTLSLRRPVLLTLFLLCSGGMIAPILGGVLLMVDRSVPVYTSVVIFAFAGFCVLLLKEDPRDPTQERVIAH